jgi:hypothetical protein
MAGMTGRRGRALTCALRACLIAAALAATIDHAAAQQPSQAQITAIRQSCRSEYMTHCASVPTGGTEALACLRRNVGALSSSCQQAVNAIPAPRTEPKVTEPKARPPAPPAPPVPAAAASPTDTPPTEPSATATGVPATPPSAAPPGDEPTPSRGEVLRIRRACGLDYRIHCSGIRPDGAEAVACLKRNAPTLSSVCQQVLGTIAGRPAAPAAPTGEPPPLLVSPGEELFMLRIACAPDYRRLCRGLLPGAGRIAACLHYYNAELSPSCQQALATLREGR